MTDPIARTRIEEIRDRLLSDLQELESDTETNCLHEYDLATWTAWAADVARRAISEIESVASQGRRIAALEQGEWLPIETAPKPTSGRRKVIDVWCVTDDHESARFYFGATMSGVKDQMLWQGRVNEVYWLDGAWRPATGLRMHGLTVTPTHWLPLPTGPQG